ncbi:hypothetical protein D3C73_426130 [compost metagenome]
MKKRNVSKGIVSGLSLMLFLTACGGSNTASSPSPSAAPGTSTAPAAANAKEVELIWYFPQAAVPADMKSVEAEANKLIKGKINATVKFMPVAFGDYTQKMNTIVASGEKVDLIWTSNWNFDYVQNQGKGAFIELDALIDKNAPEVKKSMPQFVWDGTKINGKIYGIPNYQTVTNREGFMIQKSYIDKLKIDVTKLKKIEDLEPILAQIKQDDASVTPFSMDYRGKFGNMNRSYNLENVISEMAVISLSNPDKILNQYETPEYKQYLATARSWFQKGYINQDAATLKNLTALNLSGKVITNFHNALKPGGEAETKVQFGGKDIVYVPITDVYTGTNTIITTLTAISRTSANPDRAMQLINLVNTDKTLFNLLVYGIEGKHHSKNADGSVKVIKDGGYTVSDWVMGNVFNSQVLEGKDPKVAEETKAQNESAKPSPIMGFKFQTTAVSAEIANVKTVIDEYGPGLNTGTIDAKDKLPEFQEKLKKAGIDKVIAEAQKQLDEWKKTK